MSDACIQEAQATNIHDKTCNNCGNATITLAYYWDCALQVQGAKGEWVHGMDKYSGYAKPDPRDLTCPKWKALPPKTTPCNPGESSA